MCVRHSDSRCWPCAADVAVEASVTRLARTLHERFAGQLNIAINSAGVNVRHLIEEISLEEWAAWTGSSPLEVMMSLSGRTPVQYSNGS